MTHADFRAENLNLYRACANCKHIMIAGSADQGYVSFLRQFSDGEQSSARLTLIESIPFPASFRQLALQFPVTRLPDLFRDSKIVAPNRFVPPESTTADSYAGAILRVTATSSSNPRPSPTATPAGHSKGISQSQTSRRSMRFNKHGQRLDDPLQKSNKDLVEALRQQNYCGGFFLSRCSSAQCQMSHKGKLSDDQKRALLRVAKETPCPNGSRCDDQDCIAAHECIHRKKCIYGGSCKYGPDMHNVERAVARTVSVLG